MNETTTNTDGIDAAEELRDLACRIHAWQEREGLKAAQMIREFRGLGSERTFRDLREGKVERYDAEQQLTSYRQVWAEIEARDDRAADEPLHDDLSTVLAVRAAVLRAMKSTGINRVVIATGGSGVGKTSARKLLSAKYGSRLVCVEALDLWSDRPGELLGAVLRAKGDEGLPSSTSERFVRVVEYLRKTRRCLVIDCAHHLGPHGVNTVKALVNATPGEFLLLAMETLWHKLESVSWQEARQISTNRLCERVRLRLTNEDVARYLSHTFPSADRAQLKSAAALVRPAAENAGNMLFARDCCEQARDMLAEGEQPTAQTFAEAVKAVCQRR